MRSFGKLIRAISADKALGMYPGDKSNGLSSRQYLIFPLICISIPNLIFGLSHRPYNIWIEFIYHHLWPLICFAHNSRFPHNIPSAIVSLYLVNMGKIQEALQGYLYSRFCPYLYYCQKKSALEQHYFLPSRGLHKEYLANGVGDRYSVHQESSKRGDFTTKGRRGRCRAAIKHVSPSLLHMHELRRPRAS